MRNKPWDAQLAAWFVTPLASSTVVQPNHFTSLRLLTGILGCWLFAFTDQINCAALMIALSNFVDHMDGELARIGSKTSRFGHLFDLVSEWLLDHPDLFIDELVDDLFDYVIETYAPPF